MGQLLIYSRIINLQNMSNSRSSSSSSSSRYARQTNLKVTTLQRAAAGGVLVVLVLVMSPMLSSRPDVAGGKTRVETAQDTWAEVMVFNLFLQHFRNNLCFIPADSSSPNDN